MTAMIDHLHEGHTTIHPLRDIMMTTTTVALHLLRAMTLIIVRVAMVTNTEVAVQAVDLHLGNVCRTVLAEILHLFKHRDVLQRGKAPPIPETN